MSRKNWWKYLFDQKYLDTYLTMFSKTRTREEVTFIIKVTHLKRDKKILDLACGFGRHSIEFGKKGFKVTGLDYSRFLLKKAGADAKKAHVKIKFIRGDMRKLASQGNFDLVTSLFTSFGYFSQKDNLGVLKRIHKSLKSGGQLFLDVINADAVKKRFLKEGIKEKHSKLLKIEQVIMMGKFLVNEIECFDQAKGEIRNHREWRDKDKKKEYNYYLKVYTAKQYKKMLNDAGFKTKHIWSDFKGKPYKINATRIRILAEKK